MKVKITTSPRAEIDVAHDIKESMFGAHCFRLNHDEDHSSLLSF
jgi:hypothetical protein